MDTCMCQHIWYKGHTNISWWEKIRKEKNKMSINGKVKWFNSTKGYGFIAREDKEKDVFVHSSAAQAANLELNEGDELTFEITEGQKGPAAINLQKTK